MTKFKEKYLKMDVRKRFKYSLIISMVILLMIWGQSLIPGTISQEESDMVISFFGPFYRIEKDELSDEYWHLSDLVRKIAHIVEYAILGAQLYVMGCLYKKFTGDIKLSWAFIINTFGLGLVAALIDETIQIFSHRGSLVSDIWIDLLGVCIGMLTISKILRKK